MKQTKQKRRPGYGHGISTTVRAIKLFAVGVFASLAFGAVMPAPASAATNPACTGFGNENGLTQSSVAPATTGTYTVWVRMRAANAASQLRVNVDSSNTAVSCNVTIGDAAK